MMMAIMGGSADTEANAETVLEWVRERARILPGARSEAGLA